MVTEGVNTFFRNDDTVTLELVNNIVKSTAFTTLTDLVEIRLPTYQHS